jgi:hypothetical protein
LAILFYEIQLDQLPGSVIQLRVRNSLVKGREMKCFNDIAGGEGMLEFLIDNIFVIFGGRVFQQTVGIPIGHKLCSSSRRLVPLFA